jgi:hypothetical protein
MGGNRFEPRPGPAVPRGPSSHDNLVSLHCAVRRLYSLWRGALVHNDSRCSLNCIHLSGYELATSRFRCQAFCFTGVSVLQAVQPRPPTFTLLLRWCLSVLQAVQLRPPLHAFASLVSQCAASSSAAAATSRFSFTGVSVCCKQYSCGRHFTLLLRWCLSVLQAVQLRPPLHACPPLVSQCVASSTAAAATSRFCFAGVSVCWLLGVKISKEFRMNMYCEGLP